MHCRDRRRDPAGTERLALRGRQDRRACTARRQARDRERPAFRLSQPGRRPGRGRLRRRFLRAGGRPVIEGQARLLRRGSHDDRVPPRRRRLGMPARPDRARDGSAGIDLSGDGARAARLCEQDRLPLGDHRPVGGRRFGDHRGGGGRRAGPRSCARDHDAVALYESRLAGRRRGLRAIDRRALRHRRYRAGHGGVPGHADAAVR